ncbi:MAG: hypothetical protein EOO63_02580 [Hymenobacter sp.]|nr:MAG: hypothetical protein EOO63_02580 [Hymenobacter sp.]
MAYIRDPKEDEQNQQNLTTSGQSSVVSAGQGASDPNASAAQGTSWTNLSKYLDANEGLGGGIATAVTANTQGKIDSAAGKINEYQTKAAGANDSGKAQIAKLDGYTNQIKSDPTKLNATAYRNDVATGYQGLTDASKVDGYSDASAKFGDAKADYSNLKNNDWNARSSVVQNTYGKDNAAYTKGMGLLDTLVLQGDAKGQDGINSFIINSFISNSQSFVGDDTSNALTKAKTNVQSGLDTDKGRWDTLLAGTGQVVTDKRNSILGSEAIKQGKRTERDRQLGAAESAVSEYMQQNGTPGFASKYYSAGDVSEYLPEEELAALNALAELDGGQRYTAKRSEANIDWDLLKSDTAKAKTTYTVTKDGVKGYYDANNNLISSESADAKDGNIVEANGWRVYRDAAGNEIKRERV